jgi:hypothetical protein
LAYATSIHKSQGSEYPAVVIPLAMQHYTLLERNLIYGGNQGQEAGNDHLPAESVGYGS